MGKIRKNCVNCGKVVERYPSQVLGTVYCTRECRSEYHKKHFTVVFHCHNCGKEKRVRKANFNYEGRNFCSRKCKDEWQKEGLKGNNNPFYNKKHTLETRLKVSETKKSMNLKGEKAHNYNRQPVICSECGKITYKTQYLIQRSKHHFCSLECHGKWKSKYNVGENNPNWNPNLTAAERERGRKYPEYYMFIKKVMERDNFTCDICGFYGKWGEGLNVHHLNSYDWDVNNRTNINNGITLCEECHTDFHKMNGYGKNTKEQYIEFKNKMKIKESV